MTTPTEGKAGKSPCPRCHTVPNQETGLCRCPRPFDGRIPALGLSSSALLTQAESLFENYLAARLVRARRTLTTAKVTLLRDPRNRAKLDAMRTAELETQKLHAQLLEQTRRTTKAREQAATRTGHEAGRTSAEATDDFRMVQAAKAEAALQSSESSDRPQWLRPDDRECPKCGERVPGDVTVCTCGHDFATVGNRSVAEPFLSEEEVAALRGLKHR